MKLWICKHMSYFILLTARSHKTPCFKVNLLALGLWNVSKRGVSMVIETPLLSHVREGKKTLKGMAAWKFHQNFGVACQPEAQSS